MTDAEAILFAAKAAPSPAFLDGARCYRLAPDRRSLRLIKDGPGPWTSWLASRTTSPRSPWTTRD